LEEGEQSDRICVVVDSSRIVQCKWCGITQSERWIKSRGRFFCSTSCANAGSEKCLAEAYVVCTFFLSMPLFLAAFPGSLGYGNLRLLIILVLIGLMVISRISEGMAYRKSMPRNSRRDQIPLDTALLATVTTSVVCPRCGAELDLLSIGKDRVYACGYCGATGAITVVNKTQ